MSRSMPSTSSASVGVSTEVGSSRIMKLALEIELLEDLDLLLLAGGEAANRLSSVDLNGIVSMKRGEPLALSAPVDDGRHVARDMTRFSATVMLAPA